MLFGNFWTRRYFGHFLDTFGHVWTRSILDTAGKSPNIEILCFGILLDTLRYFWILLDTFKYFWILLDTFGHVWTRLDTFGHVFLDTLGYF